MIFLNGRQKICRIFISRKKERTKNLQEKQLDAQLAKKKREKRYFLKGKTTIRQPKKCTTHKLDSELPRGVCRQLKLLKFFSCKIDHFFERFSFMVKGSSVTLFPYIPPKVDDKAI
jgi:hypothetical protein